MDRRQELRLAETLNDMHRRAKEAHRGGLRRSVLVYADESPSHEVAQQVHDLVMKLRHSGTLDQIIEELLELGLRVVELPQHPVSIVGEP
jgi:hypothetical protein